MIVNFPIQTRWLRRICLVCILYIFCIPHLASAAEEPLPIPARWTVVEAVHFALKNNPDAGVALHRVNKAKAAIDQAQAAFHPRLGIDVEYGQTNNPMYSFGNILNQGSFSNDIDFNDPGTTDDLHLAASLQYRLYNGGRDQAGLRMARAGHLAREKQQTAILSGLAYEVVRSFYTIIQAREIVAARESAVTAIATSLAVARARYETGNLLKTDLLDIEVQQATSHEQLIEARHALDLAKRAFLNMLGITSNDVQLDIAQQFPQAVPDSPDGSMRPELQSLNARVTAARERQELAKGGYFPTADLYAGYQVDQGITYDNNSGNSWKAGVRLNYTLYEGNSTSAAIAAIGAEINQVRELKRKMELTIALEIEQAKLSLQQAQERLQVTAKMMKLAEESARLSRERFKQGVVLTSDLMDAENRLTDARVHRSIAKAAKAIAIADLRRASGLPQFNETKQEVFALEQTTPQQSQ